MKTIFDRPVDRGGRRKIKDRRFRITARQTAERRTGLKRRSGFDRRIRQSVVFSGLNRRSNLSA